jgi:hypothetical protein
LGWLLLCALAPPVSAEIIDDISVKTDANGEVDALIEFSVPVQYVRHFPTRRSDQVSIYFNIIGNVPRDEWLNYETHRSPPNGLVRGLTITTRDLNTGPKIEVDLRQAATFSVGPGRTDRSILLHIKPDRVVRPALPPPVVVPPPVVAKPPPAAPPPKAAVAPAPAPAKPPPVRKPAPPPARFDGGKGLPDFPAIEVPAPASAPAAVPLTLEGRIKQANDQATVLAMTSQMLAARVPPPAIDGFVPATAVFERAATVMPIPAYSPVMKTCKSATEQGALLD